MTDGWLKLHRKILDNPVVMKDSDHLAVWVYLLLNATHTGCLALFQGKKITLKSGQLITGRKTISRDLCISESKVTRILNLLKNEQQIEQQTSSKNRLISITNWDYYQSTEQQSEQQVNNNRTTSEQQVNTNKNVKKEKKEKNVKKIEYCQEIFDLYNSICVSLPSVKKLSDSRRQAINARLKTYTLEDFKAVFEKAEASSFLRGEDGGWKASFDWLIKEANMLKVLEGNYADKPNRRGRNTNKPVWGASGNLGSAELEAIQRVMKRSAEED